MAKAKRETVQDLEQELNEVPEVVEANPYGKKEYQEWEVKINGGKAEKLKVSRQKVKITDEQADILNQGVETGGNTYAKMYFLPE
jgi:multidrug efflux pump subunit AcrB